MPGSFMASGNSRGLAPILAHKDSWMPAWPCSVFYPSLFKILQLWILLNGTYLNILEVVLFSPHKQIVNIQMEYCVRTQVCTFRHNLTWACPTMMGSHTLILVTFHFTTAPGLSIVEKRLRTQLSCHETSGFHGGYTSATSASWWTIRRRCLYVPAGPLRQWISIVISKPIYKSDRPRQGSTLFFLQNIYLQWHFYSVPWTEQRERFAVYLTSVWPTSYHCSLCNSKEGLHTVACGCLYTF